MGEGRERATTSIGRKSERHGSQAHYVNCRSAEDRSSTTGKVGKGESAGEEGRLERNSSITMKARFSLAGLFAFLGEKSFATFIAAKFLKIRCHANFACASDTVARNMKRFCVNRIRSARRSCF